MNIIDLIRNIVNTYNSLPYQLSIFINNKEYSFYDGINIIDCNNLSKDKYEIKCNFSNIDIENKKISFFNFITKLENIIKSKTFKYKFYLKDKTKPSFYIPINIVKNTFKDGYNKLISLELSKNAILISASINYIKYKHYCNSHLLDLDNYSQILVKKDIPENVEKEGDYIFIKLCHDNILITKERIMFGEKESYDLILKVLTCFDCSYDDLFIRFIPTSSFFACPIAINFQLFDLMLYKYNLYKYIFTDESRNLIENQEKLVYNINIFNFSVNMFIYNKWKQYNNIIEIISNEWYIYSSLKIILNYLYLIYIDFHKSFDTIPINIPFKMDYNRIFGSYYTRYYNNKDKVLPVLADKEYCDKKNIPYIKWNDNYFMAPENSGYVITLIKDKKFEITDDENRVEIKKNEEDEYNNIPKCIKTIRTYRNKKTIFYSNISYLLDGNSTGIFPSTLFISYGFELKNLYRNYFDLKDPLLNFELCPRCKNYIKIPSQMSIVKVVKEKFSNLTKDKMLNDENKNFIDSKVNVLAFSIDNDKTIFPYAVTNHVYNYNSTYPFIIIMLNTTKKLSIPNYRYEYITSGNSKLFNINDKCVQAILAMYQSYNISVIDDLIFNSCIIQYVIDNSKIALVADKKISNSNCYLWYSTYSNIIPNIPICNSDNLIDTLPNFSDLRSLIKNITAYHYINHNENEKIIYGVWNDDKYYPCKVIIQSNIPETLNKPFLLIPRNINGDIYASSINNSNLFIF